MFKIARDTLAKLSLLCSLEAAIIDKMEELEKEQYKIREDYKRCTSVNRNLEARYTELVYAFNAVKNTIPQACEARLAELEKTIEANGGVVGETAS